MPQAPGPAPLTKDTTCDGGVSSGKTYTRSTWCIDFLSASGIGSPDADIVQWVVAWTKMESLSGQVGFNLLNTTQPGYPGAFAVNSVGVQFFCNYKDGIEANAQVLKGGGYPNLLKALTNADKPALGINSTAFGPRYGFVEAPIVGDINKWGTGHAQQIAQLATDNQAVNGSGDTFPGDANTYTNPNSVGAVQQNIVGNVNSFFGNLNTLFSNPTRIGKGFIGVLLLIIGAVLGLNILSGGKVAANFRDAARGLT